MRSVSESILPRFSRLFTHGLLILNFGLGIGYIGAWIMAWQQGLFWRADFSAFYTGWAIVRDGLGSHLFDFALQTSYQQAILGGQSFKDGLLPFINPPGLTLLLTPLSVLPLSTAFYLWTLGMAGLLAWLIALLWKMTRSWQPYERWLLIAACVAFPPMFTTFLLGAFSLLLLVCWLQLYLAFRDNRPVAIAAWLFIGAIKPQIVILPGAMLACARRWLALGWAVLAGIGMVLLSSFLIGWRVWIDYAQQLRAVSSFFGQYGIDPAGMYNFRGLLTTVLGSGQAAMINGISTFALLGSLFVTCLVWRRPVEIQQPVFELRVALTLVMALFFNMHLYPQDGLLYIAPAILFYDYLRRNSHTQSGFRKRTTFAVFALLCPFFFLFSEFNLGVQWGIRGPVIAALVMLIWIGWEWIRELAIQPR